MRNDCCTVGGGLGLLCSQHGEQAMGELREELEAKQSELSRTRSGKAAM